LGHQGTLGIVTEATLELAPRPEAEFTAFFAFDDFGNAHRTVHGIVTSWAGWVDLKSEIAKVSLEYGGSITACHGSTRVGDAELSLKRWAAAGT
jgi:FAD/FMN-containing dehydrogenase